MKSGLRASDVWRGAALPCLLALWLVTAARSQQPRSPVSAGEPTVLQLSHAALPAGVLAHRYSQTFPVAGGQLPYTFALTGTLPPGLRAETLWNTVHIAGTPTVLGEYPITITVRDEIGEVQQSAYTVRIKPAPDNDTAINLAVSETATGVDALMTGEGIQVPVAETITGVDMTGVSIIMQYNVAVPEAITGVDTATIALGLSISPQTLAPGTVYTVYPTVTFTPSGGSGMGYHFTTSGTLPTGMNFNSGNGTLTLSGEPLQAGSYPFTVTLTDSTAGPGEEFPTSANQNYTLVVLPEPQTITIGPIPQPNYGGYDFSLSATATSGLPVTITPTNALSTGSGPFTPAGAGSATFIATQAGDANNAAAPPVTFSVPISPATLTVTATDVRRACGANNPTLPYTLAGFVYRDTSAVVSGAPALSTTATQNSTVNGSPYPITIAQGTLAAANYAFNFVNGSLTVYRGPQYITFYQPAPLAHTAYAAYFYFTGTASSGLPVIYTATGPASIDASGSILDINGPGSITVTATVASSDCYNDPAPVIRTFTAP